MQMANGHITNYQENTKQSQNEISPHTYLNGYHKKNKNKKKKTHE